jgi:hypothetical protein
MVLLNSPCRETPKNVLKKKAKKKITPAVVDGWRVWDLANARGGGGSIDFVLPFAGPSYVVRRTPPSTFDFNFNSQQPAALF